MIGETISGFILTPREVASVAVEAGVKVGRSVADLAQLRKQGAGPRFNQVRARTVRYLVDDVEEWLMSQGADVGSDHG